MFVSVPVHKNTAPCTCFFDAFESFRLIVRTVLDGFEQRFGIRVIVAHSRPVVGWGYPQHIQRFQHGCTLHRKSVVTVQDKGHCRKPSLCKACVKLLPMVVLYYHKNYFASLTSILTHGGVDGTRFELAVSPAGSVGAPRFAKVVHRTTAPSASHNEPGNPHGCWILSHVIFNPTTNPTT